MAFGNEVKTGNIVENWLFTLPNRQGGNLYLSFKDTTHSSNFYYGVILNKPSIRESIDLKNSTAKTSNISIEIPDFKYNGENISKELYGGSNQYINQVVTVKSQVNESTPIAIGSFRLTEISLNNDKITLALSSRQPWDFITAPQVKSDAPQNVYKPIAYGTYLGNTTSNQTNRIKVFPIPRIQGQGGKIYFAMHKSITDGSVVLNFYDKTSDLFPVLTANSSTETKYGADAIGVNTELSRTFRLPLSSFISSHNWNNGANVLTDDSNFASLPDESSGINFMAFNILEFGGKVTGFTVFARGELSIDTTDGSSEQPASILAKIKGVDNNSDSGSATIFSSNTAGTTHTLSGSTDIDGNGSNYKGGGFSSSQLASQNNPLQNLSIGASRGSSQKYDAKIFNAYFSATTEAPEDEPHSSSKERGDVQYVYCGNDGLPKTYTGASGIVTKIHEAHREILKSFLGVDVSDSAIETNFSGEDWSDFDTVKTNWLIRYWQLNPKPVKEILEKLQYEGGFIFKFTANNNLKYIYLKQSMTSTITLTKKDIANVSVSPSSFSDLITKMNINYEKHPAVNEKRYTSTVTSSNDTIRTNYNIQTEENILEVNLDAYVAPAMSARTTGGGSNPNNDFYSYYDNITGDIKLIIEFNLINPEYYNIDVGDIIDFSDMYPENPFGHNSGNWSGLKFIVTDLNRTCGSIKIKAREV